MLQSLLMLSKVHACGALAPLNAITTSPNLIKSQYYDSVAKLKVVPPLSSTKALDVSLYSLVASPANIDTTVPLSDLKALPPCASSS